jgi:hypothetical protein
MALGLYSLEFAMVIGGVTYAAHLLLMPTHWIVVGAVVLVGAGDRELLSRRRAT